MTTKKSDFLISTHSQYSFPSNVGPQVPHPNWSQEFETMIINGETPPSVKCNGYGEYAAHLYE